MSFSSDLKDVLQAARTKGATLAGQVVPASLRKAARNDLESIVLEINKIDKGSWGSIMHDEKAKEWTISYLPVGTNKAIKISFGEDGLFTTENEP